MNWDNFRYFLALARHKTLANAGKALLVSNVTVYRKIKAFEEELGVTLFEQTPSGYSMTSAAEQLLEEIEPVETIFESSLRELRGLDQRIHGNVLISTTDTLGCKLLPGILRKLQSAYPELSIELKINLTTVNLTKREADIVVRTSKQPPQNLVGRKVGKLKFALYAAESYLKNYGTFQLSKDTDHHHFIVLDESLSHVTVKQWMDQKTVNASHVTKVNGMLPLIEFCEAGMGIAALPTFVDSFRKSHLKKIDEIPELANLDVWVLTHRDLTRSMRIRITTEFLYHELKPYFS